MDDNPLTRVSGPIVRFFALLGGMQSSGWLFLSALKLSFVGRLGFLCRAQMNLADMPWPQRPRSAFPTR